jgi:hypothetical protein
LLLEACLLAARKLLISLFFILLDSLDLWKIETVQAIGYFVLYIGSVVHNKLGCLDCTDHSGHNHRLLMVAHWWQRVACYLISVFFLLIL